MRDVVYYVREGDNEELRYSLRSLSNLPHDNVWIVGDKPDWVTNVGFIPGNRFTERWWNAFDNVRLVVNHPNVAEDIVMMNDDFFIMNHVDEIPVYWLKIFDGPSGVRRNDSPRIASFRYIKRLIGADGSIKLYVTHTPLPVEKTKLAEVLDLVDPKAQWPPAWRSLYGNYWKIGGEQAEDNKVFGISGEWEGQDFVSTEDAAFTYGKIGKQIRSRFPNKSPYET